MFFLMAMNMRKTTIFKTIHNCYVLMPLFIIKSSFTPLCPVMSVPFIDFLMSLVVVYSFVGTLG